MHVLRITRESWVVFGGHWRITRRDRDAGRTPGLHERAGFQRRAERRRGCAGRHPRARRFPVERAPPACALATAAGCPGRAPWRGGTGGAPEAVRAGQLSKSVAKAPRGGIVREKKRGISTILLRLSGAMGAFATDLDKRRRRGPREGRPGPDGDRLECKMHVSASGARRRRAPWSARSSGDRRARHLTREHVCQSDVLAGQVTISRAGARHGMRDAVPPCEMRYRGEAGTGRRNRPRREVSLTGPRPSP